MRDLGTSILRALRSPKVVNVIGLGLVALVVLWLLVNFVKNPTDFINVGLDGLTRGTIYGVVALGYTLVYGILQLINFAHGDVFALSGLVASTMLLTVFDLTGDSSSVAVVGAIAVTLAITIPLFAAINGSIERVAYRPLRNAPRLAPLITAVGMSFIVQNVSLGLYGVDYESGSNLIPQGDAITIGEVQITWKLVSALLIIVPSLVLLSWFVTYTRQGKAMRAVAQDTEASAMMGINVNRTISITFFIAGSLAAVAGLVFLLEYNIRYDTGFELGLIAFTAAVLGGIGNLAGAVLGALLIGFIQSFNEGLDVAGPRRRLDQVDRVRHPHRGARVPSRGPPRRTNARGRMSLSDRARAYYAAGRNAWIVPLVLALGVLYPWYAETLQSLPLIGDFIPSTSSMVVMLAFTMMAVGLNIVVGYAGLLDLGYVAFYAVGAYTAGWFASQQFDQVTFHFWTNASEDKTGIHISMWVVLIIAGLLTLFAGVLIGLPTLRLRGDYLAIVTLGFGEIVPQVVRNGDNFGGFDLTHGSFGIAPIDGVGFPGLGLAGAARELPAVVGACHVVLLAAFALLLITVFCSVRLRDSRLGRAWIAIREDETAAAAMGVPLMRTKTWAYAIGAFFGGVAGAYYASFKSAAFPADFYFQFSVFLLCMVILGGMGSVWGVIVGGMILVVPGP